MSTRTKLQMALFSALFLGSMMTPAKCVDAKREKNDVHELALTVPEAALAIEGVKDELLRRFDKRVRELQKTEADALHKSCGDPKANLPACELRMDWRVTFENARVLSLSGSEIYSNSDNQYDSFDTLVWNKQASKPTSLNEFFVRETRAAALYNIAEYAKSAFLRFKSKKMGKTADASAIEDNISAEPQKLGHYALTYARGEQQANGIVLLWGAGEAWARVWGDVRISVPSKVFSKYLTPEWSPQFK